MCKSKKMSSERKCPSCGSWNIDSTCSSCGKELDPKKLRIEKIKEVRKKKELEPTPKLDAFFIQWKATKNPIYKGLYWIAYSIWSIYMGILSFILLFIAWGPG